MKKSIIILFLSLILIPSESWAQNSSNVLVNPSVIDEKTKIRDILEYDILIQNKSERQVSLYAVVNDVDPVEGIEESNKPQDLDRTVSITKWIELSRGVIRISSGEEAKVPLKINVSHDAIPGIRHAKIIFAEGNNRELAEKKAKKSNQPEILINLEIEEDIVERAELNNFSSAKNIYSSFPAKFDFTVKNIGNSNVTPIGNIYIYNRKGQEIDKININIDQSAIKPETVLKFNEKWDGENGGFGKYKAKLELEYGSLINRDLQDTVYFWILPFKLVVLVGVGGMLLIVLLSIMIFKKTYVINEPEKTSDGVINLKHK